MTIKRSQTNVGCSTYRKSAVAAAALATLGVLASPAASAATLAELASKVEASGWISGSYFYNLNGEDTVGHPTDIESNSFTLNQAVLNLIAAPEEGFGGGVQILAGNDAATIVNPSYGDGDDKFSLPEAYLTYTTGKLTVKAGRYGTLAGYEVLSDAANPLLSRSLQFMAAEPYFHTGIRAAYAATDSTTLYLGVNNSAYAGYSVDPDDQKTVEAGFATAFGESVTFAVYDYYGQDGGLDTNYLDVVLGLTASDALSFGLNVDLFTQDEYGDVLGIAGYATLAMSETWSATLRLESTEKDFDPGVDTDVTTNAATIALSYKPSSDFRMIFEARVDDADEDIYIKDGKPEGTQPTVGVKAIYSFGL